MSYLIIDRDQWNSLRPLCQSDGVEAVSVGELMSAVEARTGRSAVLTIPSVSRHLRRTGRVYVAASDRRSGVVIEAVNHPAICRH